MCSHAGEVSVLCCAALCYAVLCCAVLRYAMLCYAMLCCHVQCGNCLVPSPVVSISTSIHERRNLVVSVHHFTVPLKLCMSCLCRWLANVQAQQHWQCLNRQAAVLQHRQQRNLLQHCLTSWACLAWTQRQAQHRAAGALSRVRLFKLKRVVLAWYYTTHNLKLHKLHVQLAERQGSLLQVHQQAQQAGKVVQDLQLERARLHQRLERVAEHAKVKPAVAAAFLL